VGPVLRYVNGLRLIQPADATTLCTIASAMITKSP
jgi:hypothetical protein